MNATRKGGQSLKFEAHITCKREDSETVEGFADSVDNFWKFSAIDGDPVMGKRPYCYLTGYDTNPLRLLARLQTVSQCLKKQKVEILREKIEQIIYDTKTNYDCIEQCCGHCGEP